MILFSHDVCILPKKYQEMSYSVQIGEDMLGYKNDYIAEIFSLPDLLIHCHGKQYSISTT